jgi:mono/diheme cytochrome c family protein
MLNNSNPLAAFANTAPTNTRGNCARCHTPYGENGGRAAVNADLYNRPAGAPKQVRIAHNSQTVCEPCAAEIWGAMLALYDFAAYRAQRDAASAPNVAPPAVAGHTA